MKNLNLFSGTLCVALVCGCADNGDPSVTIQPATDTASSTTGTPQTSGTETTDAPTTTATTTSADGDGILNCDPWAQDCPDGYKCMAYTDEGDYFTGTKCTPVAANPGQVGDACYGEGGWSTGVDDCDLGLACWNINPETNIGACVALCTGTMDAYSCPEPEKSVCIFWVAGLAHVCLDTCDPLLQDCPVGQACLPSSEDGGVCLLDWSFDEGQEFDPCMSGNTCDPGLMCWDPSEAVECAPDTGCCLAICDLDAPDCTGQGAKCESIYPPDQPVPPGNANVGVCGLPG